MIHKLYSKGTGANKGRYRTEYFNDGGMCSAEGNNKYPPRSPYPLVIFSDGTRLTPQQAYDYLGVSFAEALPVLPELPLETILITPIKRIPNPDYPAALEAYNEAMATYKQMLKDTFTMCATFIYPTVRPGYDCYLDDVKIEDPKTHWLYHPTASTIKVPQPYAATEDLWDAKVTATVLLTPKEYRLKKLCGL